MRLSLAGFKSTELLFRTVVALLVASAVAQAQPPATSTVGQQAHNFGKWEKDIAAYERMDRTNPPPRGGLLFIGSSTILRWKTLAQDFPGQPVINRGFGGSEIVDSTHFADRIIFPYAPRMVFLRAGGNDLWAGKTPEQVFADFMEFATRIRAGLPEAKVFFISLSPSIARWKQAAKEKKVNDLVEQYCRQDNQLVFIDTYTITLDAKGQPRPELFVADMLHFNDEGYRLLLERVRPFMPK